MVSAKRVFASGWMEGSLAVSAVSDRKNANRCDGETQNSSMGEVRRKKEGIRFINNRRGVSSILAVHFAFLPRY